MSQRKRFDLSLKPESILQLSKYNFPDSGTDDSFNESSEENETFDKTDTICPEVGSNPVTGSTDRPNKLPHPLCSQTSVPILAPSPLTTQAPPSSYIFSPHPSLLREHTAPAAPTESHWPPLMLRPIVVNHTPYYSMGELGRGATSVVERAVDMNLKFFALKSINLEDTDQVQLDSYQNEICILQHLRDNSNVIHLFDFEYSPPNNRLYLVMECGQLDLASIIKANNNQSFEVFHIQTFWQDILKGVTAIHSMDVIHSDLKPSNFVLVNTKLKLIDFGIACSLNDENTSFEREGRWGTPNYMAPEMILSIPKNNSLSSEESVFKISQSADIWSLGCILYKLTYGVTPFQHITDRVQKWRAITNPKQVISFPEDPPLTLLQVLISCLDRNPRKRPTGLQLLSNKFLNY